MFILDNSLMNIVCKLSVYAFSFTTFALPDYEGLVDQLDEDTDS